MLTKKELKEILKEELDKRDKKFDQKIDKLVLIIKKGFDQVDQRFIETEKKSNQKFIEVKKEINDLAIMVEKGFEEVDENLDKINIEIIDVKQRISVIEKRINFLETNGKLTVDEREVINIMKSDVEVTKKRINFLEIQTQKLTLKQS